MLYKTRGIVLNHLKYGDSSLVTTIYTEMFGRKTFLVQGVYGRKGKFRPTFFQPLTLLDLDVYINPKRDLQRIKEVAIECPFHSIPFVTVKSAVSLFVAEVLYKTLKEEEANPAMFDFLFHAIQIFDIKDSGSANFHLVFLLNLTKHLGFYPQDNYSAANCRFDPANGYFNAFLASSGDGKQKYISELFHQLMNVTFDGMEQPAMNHQTRNALLNLIIEYYNHHHGGLATLNSLPVLQSIFGD
jgi:DNA repair protein RecO